VNYTFLKLSYKSVTQVLYHKTTCVLHQIPFSTINAVYYGVLTIHESNSCHQATVQNDVWQRHCTAFLWRSKL